MGSVHSRADEVSNSTSTLLANVRADVQRDQATVASQGCLDHSRPGLADDLESVDRWVVRRDVYLYTQLQVRTSVDRHACGGKQSC